MLIILLFYQTFKICFNFIEFRPGLVLSKTPTPQVSELDHNVFLIAGGSVCFLIVHRRGVLLDSMEINHKISLLPQKSMSISSD